MNRNIQAGDDGSVILRNIPVPDGAFRLRLVCEREGETIFGASDLVFGVPGGFLSIDDLAFSNAADIPVDLSLETATTELTSSQPSAQLSVSGILPDASIVDVTASSTGTAYLSSNPSIASVSPEGLVTGSASGNVLVTAIHEGVIGTIEMSVTTITRPRSHSR